MDNLEIKQKINELREQLYEIMTTENHNTFELHTNVNQIIQEIQNYQNQCTHHFENNTCIFCGKTIY